jgi:hypothetical protein
MNLKIAYKLSAARHYYISATDQISKSIFVLLQRGNPRLARDTFMASCRYIYTYYLVLTGGNEASRKDKYCKRLWL